MLGQAGRRVLVRRLLTVAMVLWTTVWTVPAVQAVGMETALGRTGVPADGVAAWQVLEVLFVLAYYGVRWLPGLALLGLVFMFLRRVPAPRPLTESGD